MPLSLFQVCYWMANPGSSELTFSFFLVFLFLLSCARPSAVRHFLVYPDERFVHVLLGVLCPLRSGPRLACHLLLCHLSSIPPPCRRDLRVHCFGMVSLFPFPFPSPGLFGVLICDVGVEIRFDCAIFGNYCSAINWASVRACVCHPMAGSCRSISSFFHLPGIFA